MSEHLQHSTSSITTAIESISSNTAKLAQETSSLSVQVVEHQAHLDNLLGFEETRRQQMDDHVKHMGDLTALIAEVKSQANIQTQHVLAQLDGLRTKVDAHISTTKSDIVDIRGCIGSTQKYNRHRSYR
jgi:hypothetical protein